jgi:hypothetical protein
VRRADNFTTFKCRLSRNLGASTYWNPVGLSRPVTGLLYLLIRCIHRILCNIASGVLGAAAVMKHITASAARRMSIHPKWDK